MTPLARRVEVTLTAAVAAAFAAFWAFNLVTNDPPEFQSQYLLQLIAMLILGTPCVVAARLLWRGWWARFGADLEAPDAPALLLAIAVSTLPEHREPWGRAMLAELAHVEDRAARWSFARSCALAALFPPAADRASSIAALRGRYAALLAVAGVFAGIASVVAFLVRHPEAISQFTPADAAALATLFAACIALAVASSRTKYAGGLASRTGIAAAVVLALGFFVTSRATVNTAAGPLLWVIVAPAVVGFVASAAAAARGGSFGVGVHTAAWTATLGGLAIFAWWLPEASHRYAIDGGLLGDGDGGNVAQNLADARSMLVIVLIQAFPFGVMGALFGSNGSLRGIGISTPSSPGVASLLLCLPLALLLAIAANGGEPLSSWFAADQPLAAFGQLLIVVSLVGFALALLFGGISAYHHLAPGPSPARSPEA